MSNIAVVTVGYSRPDSMQSLLDSILKADFLGDEVDLVVSIDKGAKQDEVVKVAENAEWTHGRKIIRAFPERQGLRPHILQCGDLTSDYEAVIVLEDDLNVSPGFYSYVKQALEFYGDDERIGGISLYSDQINQTTMCSFIPSPNGYDVFMMNLATSWGQCWNRRMWSYFRKWYDSSPEKIDYDCKIPQNIVNWDNRSWLKYFDRFVIETGKFFVYPYWALTTNCADSGEHFALKDSDFQIPLLESKIDYCFPDFSDAIKYDAFHERIGMSFEKLNLKGKVILDLNGGRTIIDESADYLISSGSHPYKIINEISLDRRPIEMNCLYPSEGKGIYIYDLRISAKAPKNILYHRARYDVRHMDWHHTLSHFLFSFQNSMKIKIKKLLKK